MTCMNRFIRMNFGPRYSVPPPKPANWTWTFVLLKPKLYQPVFDFENEMTPNDERMGDPM